MMVVMVRRISPVVTVSDVGGRRGGGVLRIIMPSLKKSCIEDSQPTKWPQPPIAYLCIYAKDSVATPKIDAMCGGGGAQDVSAQVFVFVCGRRLVGVSAGRKVVTSK